MPQHSPLHDRAARAGAVFVDAAGWLLPAHYGQPASEYRQARAQAALFDLSHHGKLEATGRDAVTFLHNLCTNDVKGLAAGAGCEAFLTTGQAKIVAFVLVNRGAPSEGQKAFWLDVGPGMGEKVFKHLDRHLISEQVELDDRSREFAQLHLAGPEARAALERAAGALPDLKNLHEVERSFGAGAAGRIRRHEPLNLPGYDLVFPNEVAETVWQALCSVGAQPAGLDAYQVLRVEAGTPVYGVDIDETHLPQEVARDERALSFTKGCYIGQETVARIRTYGHVNRLFVGLKLAAGTPLPAGAKVYREGKEVGQVTSSVVSPKIGTAIALGYVRRGSHAPGTALEVEAAGSRLAAEVVSLPF